MTTWIIDNNEIIGLGLDFLALIVSIVLTVLIYKLERKHEKEHEFTEEEGRKERIKEEAKVFLVDNEDEIEYLPISQVASSLQLKRKHNRSIITKFLRCSEDVKNEILIQAGIQKTTIKMDDIHKYVDLLDEDLRKNHFGTQILYDGAKYLHRAFERWANQPVENSNSYIFENLKTTEIHGRRNNAVIWRCSNYDTNLFTYMWEYMHPNEVDLKIEDITPPVDMIFQKCNLGSCEEHIMTFWPMRIVIDACQVLRNPSLDNIFDESLITTQEEMYYYTLYVLYQSYRERGDAIEQIR